MDVLVVGGGGGEKSLEVGGGQKRYTSPSPFLVSSFSATRNVASLKQQGAYLAKTKPNLKDKPFLT